MSENLVFSWVDIEFTCIPIKNVFELHLWLPLKFVILKFVVLNPNKFSNLYRINKKNNRR